MKQENDRWVLKQRIEDGRAKAKDNKSNEPETAYAVRISFDETKFQVFVDDLVTLVNLLFTLIPQEGVQADSVEFQTKNTPRNSTTS